MAPSQTDWPSLAGRWLVLHTKNFPFHPTFRNILLLRNMADARMSAEELRKRLKEYGISTGPITPSTFPVYLSKLNNFRNRVNQGSRRTSAGRSSSSTVSAAADLNGFSCDESDTESEDRWGRLSMSANYDTGRTRRNHQFDVTRSSGTVLDTAQPEGSGSGMRNLSAYEQLSLVRPSIRTYSYDGSTSTDRYGVPQYGIGASPMQWNRQTLLLGSGNSSAARAGKAASSGLDESRQSWLLISRVIVLLLLFVVVVVVLSYCFITRSSLLLVDTRSDYILCSDDASSPPKCTSHSELGLIQKMIRELLDALSTRAGEYDCGYQSDARSMSRSEIIQLLDDGVLITADKQAADYLPLIAGMCLKNDNWGVEVHGDSSDRDFSLESVVGKKSLWCRITDSARYIFSIVVLTFLFVGAGCGLFVFIRIRRTAADAEHREVLDLVEKIIDMLRQNAEAAAVDSHERPVPPYLAIPHVRDALIPLHLRRVKQHIWDQAVKFLSAHESRVRLEYRQISGEGQI